MVQSVRNKKIAFAPALNHEPAWPFIGSSSALCYVCPRILVQSWIAAFFFLNFASFWAWRELEYHSLFHRVEFFWLAILYFGLSFLADSNLLVLVFSSGRSLIFFVLKVFHLIRKFADFCCNLVTLQRYFSEYRFPPDAIFVAWPHPL